MENIALIDSFSEFKDNKSIDRVTLMSILEEVFRSALKRKFGSDDNFDIIINPDKGDLEIWRNRVVVADGFSEDDNEEIELATTTLFLQISKSPLSGLIMISKLSSDPNLRFNAALKTSSKIDINVTLSILLLSLNSENESIKSIFSINLFY